MRFFAPSYQWRQQFTPWCNNFRQKTLKASKTTLGSGTAKSSARGGSGSKGKGPSKTAKPLSYDNYSTDTSSQFSVDIVDVPSNKESAKYERIAASAVVAQVSSNNEEGVNKLRHYPDYSTIPHLPNLKDLATQDSESKKDMETLNESLKGNAEVVLNASKLQVESEIA